ncbi:uncharacterized protein [Antedon mediterranea]|uniref:uncharacterized protein n=1 Tax=Antedon mediterranea TaxID=105859 RepID=UPI003AF4FB39
MRIIVKCIERKLMKKGVKQQRSKTPVKIGLVSSSKTEAVAHWKQHQVTRTVRKQRVVFTKEQLFHLNQIFAQKKYLSARELYNIAIQLKLKQEEVKNWFQNNRAKIRTKNNSQNLELTQSYYMYEPGMIEYLDHTYHLYRYIYSGNPKWLKHFEQIWNNTYTYHLYWYIYSGNPKWLKQFKQIWNNTYTYHLYRYIYSGNPKWLKHFEQIWNNTYTYHLYWYIYSGNPKWLKLFKQIWNNTYTYHLYSFRIYQEILWVKKYITLGIQNNNIMKEFTMKERCCYKVAASGDVVLGTVAVQDVGNDTAEIIRMYVSSVCQRSGVGGKLIDNAIEFCVENGFKNIVVITGAGNSKAISFYKKYGFIEVCRFLLPVPGKVSMFTLKSASLKYVLNI